jgi:Cupin domain
LNHEESIRRRILLAAAVGAAIGAGGLSLASHDDHGPETVTKISERDVIEKLNGKEARVTMIEVAFGPGVAGQPHRHPGPIFGSVLEGEFELGLDDQPVKTLKAGDDVLRAERGPASGVPRPEHQDEDQSGGRHPAPPGRGAARDPGRQGVTPALS